MSTVPIRVLGPVTAPERRAGRRFPICVEIEYTLHPHAQKSTIGRGATVNLSCTGVLFRSKQPLPVGKPIRFSLAWPALLGGKVGLKLTARGRTVRAEHNCVAVQFSHHEFRTRTLQLARGLDRT